jgi:hypothetical protein
MKRVANAMMALGVLVLAGGIAWPYQSDSRERCLQESQKAVALADAATKAEGTPQAQDLMAQSQSESEWADNSCATADEYKTQSLVIAGGGLLLLVVGFVLSRKK